MVVTPLSLGSQLAGAGAVPLLILFRRTKSQSDEPCSECASQSATAREACIVAPVTRYNSSFRIGFCVLRSLGHGPYSLVDQRLFHRLNRLGIERCLQQLVHLIVC